MIKDKKKIDEIIKTYTDKGIVVKRLAIDMDVDDQAIGYVQNASRHVLSPIIACITTDPMRATELWLESCLIKEISDPRILEDDNAFVSASIQMNSIVQLKKSSLTSI